MRYFFLLFSLTLFAADPIGKVTAADGTVIAKTNSAERSLTSGSDIFSKETIIVGTDALAQIQFTDGGIINLIAETEYRVNTYKYQKTFQRDESSSELMKGGFRMLSGSIAQKNPGRQEIKTPSATIGLRGTIVEARLVGDELFVGLDSGKALISNSYGSVLIGEGEKVSYARIPGNNIPPAVVVQRPLELERSLFNPPAGGIIIDQVRTSPSVAPSSTAAPSRSTTTPTPPPSNESEAPSISETPDEGGSQLLTPSGGGGASIQSGC